MPEDTLSTSKFAKHMKESSKTEYTVLDNTKIRSAKDGESLCRQQTAP